MSYIFTLDFKGGAEILKEMAAEAVSELALQFGAEADNGAKVSEYSQITDRVSQSRFVATVSVPAYRQAKDGALTKAAASLGLEIHPYPNKKSSKPKAKSAK